MELSDLQLDVSQSVDINASIGDVYSAMLRRFGEENATPDGSPLPMVLEEWPGGRWFRDLGQNQGHLWGLVQVIKPPTLLEISGPMFMSYAAAGHLQVRLTQISGGTKVALRHQVLGFIDDRHRQGVTQGWQAMLERIKAQAEK